MVGRGGRTAVVSFCALGSCVHFKLGWCGVVTAGSELPFSPYPICGGVCKDTGPFSPRWLIIAGACQQRQLGAEKGQGHEAGRGSCL